MTNPSPSTPPGHPPRPGAPAYLHPGHMFTSRDGARVTTIVGSCVAVCLHDPIHHVGGMNHYLLAASSVEGERSPRFGRSATPMLVDAVAQLGGVRRLLRASIFGGACVVDAFRGARRHLGEENVDVAREVLAALGIPIVAEDVGGRRGRRITFDTGEGNAIVKVIG